MLGISAGNMICQFAFEAGALSSSFRLAVRRFISAAALFHRHPGRACARHTSPSSASLLLPSTAMKVTQEVQVRVHDERSTRTHHFGRRPLPDRIGFSEGPNFAPANVYVVRFIRSQVRTRSLEFAWLRVNRALWPLPTASWRAPSVLARY